MTFIQDVAAQDSTRWALLRRGNRWQRITYTFRFVTVEELRQMNWPALDADVFALCEELGAIELSVRPATTKTDIRKQASASVKDLRYISSVAFHALSKNAVSVAAGGQRVSGHLDTGVFVEDHHSVNEYKLRLRDQACNAYPLVVGLTHVTFAEIQRLSQPNSGSLLDQNIAHFAHGAIELSWGTRMGGKPQGSAFFPLDVIKVAADVQRDFAWYNPALARLI